GASILGAAVSSATRGPSYNKDRCFTLLVIDDQNTDWSKYFRGRRLHGDYEIRVEQAEFRELSLTATETGSVVSMAVYRNGTKVIRSFKPDFVLIRQNLKDAGEDYKNLLLGLMYGGVPSVNNLTAIYNFQFNMRMAFLTATVPSGQTMGVCAPTWTSTSSGERQLPVDRANLLSEPS
ncbi:unnamed protein product, partial [Heterotrigona itama]